MTPSLTLLVLDTPHRKPARPIAGVSDITTANDEERVVGVQAIRRRRPVVPVAALIVVGATIPATGASKRQSESATYPVVRPSEYRRELAPLGRGIGRVSRWDAISCGTWSLVVSYDTTRRSVRIPESWSGETPIGGIPV